MESFTWFGSAPTAGAAAHSRIDCVGRTWSPSSTVATITVCVESSTLNGTKWLELGIYARIGSTTFTSPGIYPTTENFARLFKAADSPAIPTTSTTLLAL